MTMPDERTRSLLQTGAFLKELSKAPSVPFVFREEACRLLRHYPTINTLSLLASIEAKYTGSNLLTPDFEPSWLAEYRLNGHTL